jgi:hypothetical protein
VANVRKVIAAKKAEGQPIGSNRATKFKSTIDNNIAGKYYYFVTTEATL